MADYTNKTIEAIQSKLTSLIDFYTDNNLRTLAYNECFDKTVSMLDRAKKEFDANLFFILMFGSLKAGKSTLTNLLAREYVSPTGFGIETTLRPSIIVKSPTKEYSIDVYEIVDARDDKEELFNIVIDALRGISDISVAKSRIRKVTKPLTEKDVKEQLIGHLDSEPLITVLNVPGGNLVTEHIALIDMPGLDGVKSNWQESVIHKWILNRADFLIFIQSSMAALNKATFEFLKDAYLSSKKPPLWLVQNVIDAKYWRTDEQRTSDTISQQRQAKGQITSLLGIAEDLRNTAINLGKASDGINANNETLINESKFLDFENSLKDILKDSRGPIQQKNSIKGVLTAIRNCNIEFDSYKEKLNTIYTEFNEQINKLAEPKNIFNSMCRTIKDDAIKREVEALIRRIAESWKGKCYIDLDKDRLTGKLISNLTFEQLQFKVNDVIDSINVSRREDYFEESSTYKHEMNDLAQKYLIDLEADTIRNLNDYLNSLGIRPYDKKFKFEPKSKPESFVASSSIFALIKKSKEFDLLKALTKKDKFQINISEACDALRREYDDYRDKLIRSMTNEVAKEFDEWIKKEYKDLFSEYINEQTEQKKQEITQRKELIDDTMAFISELQFMCAELVDFIENNIS